MASVLLLLRFPPGTLTCISRLNFFRCAFKALVAARGVSRESKAVAASSAYSEAQKRNSNSPL